MALSGHLEVVCTGNGNYGKFYTLCLDWSATQDVANNRSYVTLTPSIYYNSSHDRAYNTDPVNALAFCVGGNWLWDTMVRFDSRGTSKANPYYFKDANYNQVTHSQYIDHNPDGSLTIQLGFRVSIKHSSITGGTVVTSATLDTIPRASTPTLSKSTFNIGETITINTNRLSSSFTHSIYMQRADGLYYDPIATNVGDSWSWQTGALLYQQIPNDDNYQAELLLRTFNGSTQIGDKKVPFTAYVTDSNPVMGELQYTATRTDLTGNDQTAIKGVSDVTITWPQATPKNYASIKQYVVKLGDKQQTIIDTTSPQVSATFQKVTSPTFTVEAIDSRTMHSIPKEMTVAGFINYEPLSITSAQVKRKNGVDSETTLSYSGKMFTGSLGAVDNTLLTSFYTYAAAAGGTVTGATNITPTLSETGNLSFNGPIWGDEQSAGFAMGGSYSVVLEFSDKLSSVTVPLTLNSGTPGMYMKKNQDGTYMVSFGKAPTASAASGIDVAGDIYINGQSFSANAIPIGTILRFGGSKLPTGFLWVDNTDYNRTDYPLLYQAVGLTYSEGHTDTTFNFRKRLGKVSVARNPSDSDFSTPGNTLGEKKHALSVEELPKHKMRITMPLTNIYFASGGENIPPIKEGGISGTSTFESAEIGGNQPHNNIQPSIVDREIVKAYNPASMPTPQTDLTVDGTFRVNGDFIIGGKAFLDKVYPVGSVYMTISPTSPGDLFGGTWERIKSRFLLAADETYTVGTTGGTETVALLNEHMPRHNHEQLAIGDTINGGSGFTNATGLNGDITWHKHKAIGWTAQCTGFAGAGQAHNNMPPYMACYIWKRTA